MAKAEIYKFCKLCGKAKILQESHIIPRSYFKKAKKGVGQLVMLAHHIDVEDKLQNADPKEELFCKSCEEYLERNFEKYGIGFLRKYKNAKHSPDSVSFPNFDYKKYSLYLISILWRASIATIDFYQSVNFSKDFNDLLKFCIKNNTLQLTEEYSINRFLKICIARVIDEKSEIDDSVFKSMVTNIDFQNISGGRLYYFMIEGFLISFIILEPGHFFSGKFQGEILDSKVLTIPKADIKNFGEINTFLDDMIKKHKVALEKV